MGQVCETPNPLLLLVCLSQAARGQRFGAGGSSTAAGFWAFRTQQGLAAAGLGNTAVTCLGHCSSSIELPVLNLSVFHEPAALDPLCLRQSTGGHSNLLSWELAHLGDVHQMGSS